MANQIGPYGHNASDWFANQLSSCRFDVIPIYHEQQPFLK